MHSLGYVCKMARFLHSLPPYFLAFNWGLLFRLYRNKDLNSYPAALQNWEIT